MGKRSLLPLLINSPAALFRPGTVLLPIYSPKYTRASLFGRAAPSDSSQSGLLRRRCPNRGSDVQIHFAPPATPPFSEIIPRLSRADCDADRHPCDRASSSRDYFGRGCWRHRTVSMSAHELRSVGSLRRGEAALEPPPHNHPHRC
jgi:hypothetical protein